MRPTKIILTTWILGLPNKGNKIGKLIAIPIEGVPEIIPTRSETTMAIAKTGTPNLRTISNNKLTDPVLISMFRKFNIRKMESTISHRIPL
jgi:hypothetical protein